MSPLLFVRCGLGVVVVAVVAFVVAVGTGTALTSTPGVISNVGAPVAAGRSNGLGTEGGAGVVVG